MTTRPAYLHVARDLHVRLDAGLALLVSQDDGPPRRLPLNLLSRIVCGTSARWDTDALLACMQKGIPVQWTDAAGHAVGWSSGTRRVETTMGHLLRIGLDDCDWEVLYRDWLRHHVRATAQEALRYCGESASEDNIRNVQNVLCNLHFRTHGQPCGAVCRALRSLVLADVHHALHASVDDPALLNWARPGECIVMDFAAVLAANVHKIVNRAGRLPSAGQEAGWAVLQYEKHAAEMMRECGALLGHFERFLRKHWL